MKILLVAINAKYIHSNLAVHSLKAYAAKYKDNIDIVEYTINNSMEDILKGIYKEHADIVAFSCYIWNVTIIKQIICELKKVQPQVKIWFGGPEVSYDAQSYLMEMKELNGIILGEGEQTFLEFMEYYVDKSIALEEVRGLIFKNSARVEDASDIKFHHLKNELDRDEIVNTSYREPMSLNMAPFPYENMEDFRNKIVYYESSRGCPFSCSYCLSSIEQKVRFKDIDLVKKDLQIFLDYKVPQVKFVDRTFNCNRQHAMGIWKFIKEQDNGITNFHFEISADLITEEELQLLATLRPGQVQFEIGVQSTNPETIEAIHRKMDLTKLFQNVQRLKQSHNIHQHLDLIAGLPLEDFSTFRKSFQEVYAVKPDQLQLGFLKILKGSNMELDREKYGIVYQNNPPYEILYHNLLNYSEVLRLKAACEMVEIYYNSGQFTYSIKYLEHFYPSSLDLYLSIADYYEVKKYDQIAHSRIKRYEILLEFYCENVTHKNSSEHLKRQIFQELLIYDLYLREDMKNRPLFAPPAMEYKEISNITIEHQLNKKMIHMEKFQFDIMESANTGRLIQKNIIYIFDYSRRDPLNKSADVIRIDLEE